MKKTKLIATLSAIIITATSCGLAYADTTVMNIQTTVDSVTEISGCGSVSFPSDFTGFESGQITPACTVSAASNGASGFYIELHGTDLSESIYGNSWSKLDTASGGMDTACSSNCQEEWGFRIINGTASEYETVETDTDNELTAFDSNATTCGTGGEPCWHTVNSSASPETIISHSNSSGSITRTANFDLEFGAVASNTLAGTYTSQITITITAI